MPIEVKHGAAPGSYLHSRFGAAQGQAMSRGMEQFLRARERQTAQRSGQEFRRETSATEHERAIERSELGHLQSLEKREFEYRLSSQQIADESKYRNALYEVEGDESLSPQDKDEARDRIAERLDSIQPLPTRKPPSPYPEGRGMGEYWYDEKYGGWVARDTKGNIKELTGSRMSEKEAWTIAINSNTDESGKVNMPEARKMVGDLTGGAGPGGQPQVGPGQEQRQIEEKRPDLRPDGTPKGPGFFGTQKGAGELEGYDMTEYSIGVKIDDKEMDIPTMVPTLTEEELGTVLKGEVTPEIAEKAKAHAKKRIFEGKSPYADKSDKPISQADRSLRVLKAEWERLTGVLPKTKQETAMAGVSSELIDPGKIDNIPKLKLQTKTWKAKLAVVTENIEKIKPRDFRKQIGRGGGGSGYFDQTIPLKARAKEIQENIDACDAQMLVLQTKRARISADIAAINDIMDISTNFGLR